MVSTNHFRGRKLSKSVRAPVSPRHPHVQAAIVPPLATGCLVTFNVNAVGAGGLSTCTKTNFKLTNWAGGEWFEFFPDDQGHTAAWECFMSFGGTTIHCVYSVDFGSGFEHLAAADDSSYNGTDNYDSGPLLIVPLVISATGTIEVILNNAGHPP
jgi:hypothetical protein